MHRHKNGFTLIELSIVLVIIGLIVGGILTGRNLIKSAELNSLITQMQKLQTAVNTFKSKYGNRLPGDIDPVEAGKFGLFQCTWSGHCGAGLSASLGYFANDDDIIYMGMNQGQTLGGGCGGECGMFWRHLSETHLIEGMYGADLDYKGDPVTVNAGGYPVLSLYQPSTRINDTYVAVANMSFSSTLSNFTTLNAFYLLRQGTAAGQVPFYPSLTPIDMAAVDNKIDDGLPVSGKVMVEYSGQFGTSNNYGTTLAVVGSCAYGVGNIYDWTTYAAGRYNISPATGGGNVACIPVFLFN